MISAVYYFVKYLTNREYKDNKQIGSKQVEYDNLIENADVTEYMIDQIYFYYVFLSKHIIHSAETIQVPLSSLLYDNLYVKSFII